MREHETIRIFGMAPDSIVDGPGLRFAVFVQGCAHACPGCHNPESWAYDGGTVETIDSVFARIAENKLLAGVTLSGGEPFDQAAACAELARRCRETGLDVWVYTGYLYEDVAARAADDPAVGALLAHADVLVDGPFVQSRKSYALKWRGSANQRIIDMRKMRAAALAKTSGGDQREAGPSAVVLWESHDDFPQKPPSW